MTNALSVQVQMDEWALMERKADMLIKSRLLPDTIDTPAKAIAIMLYAQELSVPDWTALKHINVIQGAPQIDGQLTLALLNRSGLLERFVIKRSDTEICTVVMKRRGQPEFEVTCTIREVSTLIYYDKEKKAHPLTEKYNWKQQPKTMLFWFTVKQGGRRLFSDVLNGMAGSKFGDLVITEDTPVTDEAVYDVIGAEDAPKPEATVSRIVTSQNPQNGAPSAESPDKFTQALEEFGAHIAEGEIIEDSGAPAWTAGQAKAWAKAQQEQLGLTDGELLKALGVSRLGEWQSDAASATQQVTAWLNEQLSPAEGS